MKGTILLFLPFILLVFCQTPKLNNEKRKTIFLTKEEKEFVLMEMRELLRAVHQIHSGLFNEDYEYAFQVSKKVGMNMVNELQAAEKMILLKLPSEFKKLGFATHNQFDVLADSIKQKEPKKIQENLSILTSYCVSCHDLYRFEVEYEK